MVGGHNTYTACIHWRRTDKAMLEEMIRETKQRTRALQLSVDHNREAAMLEQATVENEFNKIEEELAESLEHKNYVAQQTRKNEQLIAQEESNQTKLQERV